MLSLPRTLTFILFAFAITPHGVRGDEATLRVLSSIKPISLIVEDLGGEWLSSETLLPANASPHDYALRVSEMRLINQADLLVWLGPSMERFLEKPLAGRKGRGVVTLLGDEELDDEVLNDEKLAHQERDAEQEKGHSHLQDPHLWLDPVAATEFAEHIAGALMEQRPERTEEITKRLATVRADYAALQRELEQQFADLAQQPFLVYHRGFDPLVNRFALNQLNWVTITPEQPPGARHLARLEQQIKQSKARCLFTDTAHPSSRANTIAQRYQLQLVSLDILGSDAKSYRELMINIGRDMAACLNGA